MNFYFSSLFPNTLEGQYLQTKPNGCVLLSQLNDRSYISTWIERNKQAEHKVKLFIDSGAYTCWTKGTYVDIDEYITYINSISDYIECFASLDVIPGKAGNARLPTEEESDQASRASWENFLYMRERVKHPDKLIYIFHIGENPQYLRNALSYKDKFGPIKYMGLGGLVRKTDEDVENFLSDSFDIISKSENPNIQVHTFGMTRFKVLKRFPIYSTDSTSYIQQGAFGTIMMSNTILPVSDSSALDNRNVLNRNPAVKEQLNIELKRRGLTLEELQSSRDKRVYFNCISYYEAAQEYKYEPPQRVTEESLW